MVLAVPAPELLVHDDVSDASLSSNSEYCKVDSDNDSSYKADSDSSGEQEVEMVVLSDDEQEEIQMVVPVLDAKEGDKELPIDMEVLPDVPNIVKQEVVAEEAQEAEKTRKNPFAWEVHRSERLKHLKH